MHHFQMFHTSEVVLIIILIKQVTHFHILVLRRLLAHWALRFDGQPLEDTLAMKLIMAALQLVTLLLRLVVREIELADDTVGLAVGERGLGGFVLTTVFQQANQLGQLLLVVHIESLGAAIG